MERELAQIKAEESRRSISARTFPESAQKLSEFFAILSLLRDDIHIDRRIVELIYHEAVESIFPFEFVAANWKS